MHLQSAGALAHEFRASGQCILFVFEQKALFIMFARKGPMDAIGEKVVSLHARGSLQVSCHWVIRVRRPLECQRSFTFTFAFAFAPGTSAGRVLGTAHRLDDLHACDLKKRACSLPGQHRLEASPSDDPGAGRINLLFPQDRPHADRCAPLQWCRRRDGF